MGLEFRSIESNEGLNRTKLNLNGFGWMDCRTSTKRQVAAQAAGYAQLEWRQQQQQQQSSSNSCVIAANS